MKKRALLLMEALFGLMAGMLPAVADCDSGKAPEQTGQFVGLQKAVVKHVRGRVVNPEATKRHHAGAKARHDHKMKSLPVVTLSSFDVDVADHTELPTNDQGQCGDCFGVSSADGCSSAMVAAGIAPNDGSFRLSSQYGLDSGAFQGGCNGGDEAQVIDFIKQNGFPLTSDYGPYTASPQRPKDTTGMKFYKITDWGYCTPSQQEGIASTQDMKNAMVFYKAPLSVAFDAGECDNYQWPQTMTGRGQNVDHAVLCVGWDDNHDNGDGSKGAFIGKNQWGQWGGPGCRFWIKYGSDSWGTEAIWMTANGQPPVPPGPQPPVPPVPPGPQPVPTPTIPCGPLRRLLGRCDMPPANMFDMEARKRFHLFVRPHLR